MDTHQKLITRRDEIVADYGNILPIRERTTAISPFPGGSGFLTGEPGERRFMFICHNYDGTDNLKRYPKEDYKSPFWLTLNAYWEGADIGPEEVFLTNYFMGAKPGKASGEMASFGGKNFCVECRDFFYEQVRLTNPSVIVVCGDPVWDALVDWNDPRKVKVAHPSSNRNKSERRKQQAAKWVRAIKEAMARLGVDRARGQATGLVSLAPSASSFRGVAVQIKRHTP